MKFDWSGIKVRIIAWLKSAFIKEAVKKILGASVTGGIKGWIVKKIVTEFADEIGVPVANGMLNNVGYGYEKIKGHVLIKRLKKAHENHDQVIYDSTIDDIYS